MLDAASVERDHPSPAARPALLRLSALLSVGYERDQPGGWTLKALVRAGMCVWGGAPAGGGVRLSRLHGVLTQHTVRSQVFSEGNTRLHTPLVGSHRAALSQQAAAGRAT